MKEDLSKTDSITILHNNLENLRAEVQKRDSGFIAMGKEVVEIKTILTTTNTIIEKLVTAVDNRAEKMWKEIGILKRWRNITVWSLSAIGTLAVFFRENIINVLQTFLITQQ